MKAIDNRSYHYHRSVEQWLKNFETHWERIHALDPVRFNEEFRRTWLFYLGGAIETFEAAREIINCYHITFVKGHFARRGRSTPMSWEFHEASIPFLCVQADLVKARVLSPHRFGESLDRSPGSE